MGQYNLKKGYDIALAGPAERRIENSAHPRRVAVQPIDFRGLRPALKVQPGDTVKRGSVLFVDKKNPEVKFLSPAAGTVASVVRGERRVIQRIIIDTGADSAEEFQRYSLTELKSLSREDAVKALMVGGLWPALRKRPYTRIADPEVTPKAIFISAVDSAPLQAETDFILEDRQADFQAGIEVLRHLTDGVIHVSTSPKTQNWFQSVQGVELHTFKGPHPAGNISVQAYHIDRIRNGETIWFISPRHVAQIGRVLTSGQYDSQRLIAQTGPGVPEALYVRSMEGAEMESILRSPVDDSLNRIISGNVLTGRKSAIDGFLGYYDDMLTVLPEVTEKRFFGWVQPGFNAPSFWRTFVSTWLPRKPRSINTDKNGEDRAFVATGEYEKVMPMDILPMHLAKAVLIEDIELMEQLGIFEVAPEDFALCSYICPSKIEFGEIFEHGMLLMEKEG